MVRVGEELSIRAKPEKIGKILFQLELFQRFLRDVKEIRILERDVLTGRQRSSWRVEMEGVELQWQEEEWLDLKKGEMIFRQVEGDFKQFQGLWEFSEIDAPALNAATRVRLTVEYDLGLPAFEELIGDLLRMRVLANSKRLLKALKTCLEGDLA